MSAAQVLEDLFHNDGLNIDANGRPCAVRFILACNAIYGFSVPNIYQIHARFCQRPDSLRVLVVPSSTRKYGLSFIKIHLTPHKFGFSFFVAFQIDVKIEAN